MRTTAERCGDRWVLHGRKHWITGGGVSRLHLVFGRVIEGGRDRGIAGFLVVREPERDAPPGLIVGRREPTMGLRALPETEIRFEGLEVPHDMMLVPPGGPERGFAQLMRAYNGQRLGAATVAYGIARGAFDQALAHVRERRQFGRPICEFQGLQWMLVDMKNALDAARLLIERAARTTDRYGFPEAGAVAQAKIVAAESAVRITNDALQLHGAAGYSRRRPLERMVRDARMFTIGGGTAQVLRNLVASQLLGRRLPQTRDGWLRAAEVGAERHAD